MQINLTSDMQQIIADSLADGDNHSPEEVVLLALRQWRANILINSIGTEELQEVLQSAANDMRPGRPAEEVFERLLGQYREEGHAADAA